MLAFEIDELEGVDAFDDLQGEYGGLIGPEDIEFVASKFEPNSSAALLLWEDLWAAPFAEALRDSGGVLLRGCAHSPRTDRAGARRRCPSSLSQRERGVST